MAFPTTSAVLDNFDRADEGPPPSASWENVINGLRVASNQCASNVGAADNQSSFKTSYGPDAEVWATVTAKPGASPQYMGLMARWATGGVNSGYAAYWVEQAGTDTWEIYKVTVGVYVQLGATVTGPEVTVGDKVGLEVIGNTISMYLFTGGSWSQTISRTDSTYSGAGYIGMSVGGSPNGRWDDFGGGTVITATGTANPIFRLGRGSAW